MPLWKRTSSTSPFTSSFVLAGKSCAGSNECLRLLSVALPSWKRLYRPADHVLMLSMQASPQKPTSSLLNACFESYNLLEK